jgi:hypothetical protein
MATKPEAGQPITVEIGDRTMELRFPLRVMRDLEAAGIRLLRDGRDGLFNVITSPEKMIDILYAGLRTKQPDVTPDWVADNIDATMMTALMPLIVYAMTGQWAGDAAAEKNAVTEANLSTGSPSGLMDGTTSVSAKPNSGAFHSLNSAP